MTTSSQQAARDFENLAAVQKLFDDLTAANAAVGEFRTHYEAYLRSHVKFALDRVQARSDVAADHAERLRAAAAARRVAVAAERAAEADREASRSEGETLQGRLAGLKNSEEYKAQGRIEDKRREVAARAAEVARQRDGLDRDRRRLADQTAAVGKLAHRVTGSRAEADRIAAALADAAQRSGIADDGFGPVDAGDELITTARARVAARRDDIGEIRRLLDAIRDAKAKRAYAEQELARKIAAHERQQHDADTAAARLAAARTEAAETLTAWSARWAPPSDAPHRHVPAADAAPLPVDGPDLPDHLITAADVDALAEVLERTGEPGAASLAEAYDRCTADRQAATITAQANLGAALREARRRLTDLRAERDAIAAEQDDAPPASDLRPATRDARPGAPLWQLVRFAPDVPDETAAAIEGALYGAGLLTAWVHPDPALTATALDAAEADGYLIPTAAVSAPGASPGATSGGARTLADVLIAEDQEHVPTDVIVAVLRSITLTDDIMASGSDIPARPVSRGVDYLFGHAPEPAAARSVASSPPAPRLHQGPVQLRRPRRRPAEAGPRVHRRDQPGRPPPRPAGRAGRAHRRRRRTGARARRPGRPSRRAARRLPPRPPRAARHPPAREGGRDGRPSGGAARQDPGRRRDHPGHPGQRDRRDRRQDPPAPARRRRAPHAHRRDRRRRDRPRRRRVRERRVRSAQGARHPRPRGRRPGRAHRGGRAPAPGAARGRGRPRRRRAACRPPSTRSSARSRRPCRPTFSTSSSRSGRPSAHSRTPSRPYAQHDLRARGEHDKVTAADRDVLNERQSLADADRAALRAGHRVRRVRPPRPAAAAERRRRARLAGPGRLAGRPAQWARTSPPGSPTARRRATRRARPGRAVTRARSRPPSPRSSTRSPPRPEAAARSPRGR